jgi:hypothetical protein
VDANYEKKLSVSNTTVLINSRIGDTDDVVAEVSDDEEIVSEKKVAEFVLVTEKGE